MKIQPEGAAMKPATPNTELPPSSQLRQAVFGDSRLPGKKVLGTLAICAVAMLSSWIATPAANAVTATEYKLKIPFGLEETAVVIPADNPLTVQKIELGRVLFFDRRLSN
ncbi:MAG: hypothetical protein ACREIJ_10035, partial [Nitrospiraceae bacterium]